MRRNAETGPGARLAPSGCFPLPPHGTPLSAERRLGELLIEQKATVGIASGTRGQLAGRDASGGAVLEPPEDKRPTLADIGVDKKLSSHAQKVAAIPEAEFEGIVGVSCRIRHHSIEG